MKIEGCGGFSCSFLHSLRNVFFDGDGWMPCFAFLSVEFFRGVQFPFDTLFVQCGSRRVGGIYIPKLILIMMC